MGEPAHVLPLRGFLMSLDRIVDRLVGVAALNSWVAYLYLLAIAVGGLLGDFFGSFGHYYGLGYFVDCPTFVGEGISWGGVLVADWNFWGGGAFDFFGA